MTTAFDPNAFLNTTVDQPLDTEFTVCPEGIYQAMIDSFDDVSKLVDSFEFTYKRGEKAGQPGTMDKFTIPCVIQDAKVQQTLGRDKVVVPAPCTLEWEGGQRGGRLATGPNKNVLLGQIKNAVGQNVPGVSLAQLAGAGPFMVEVRHRMDEKNPGKKYAEVFRAAPIR